MCALTISLARGLVVISICIVTFAFLFDGKALWLCATVSELICLALSLTIYVTQHKKAEQKATAANDPVQA